MDPKLADTLLTSDATLSKLYDVKGSLPGILSGRRGAVHRETGIHYAMLAYVHTDLTRRKQDELCCAITAQRRLNDAPEGTEDLRSARLLRLHEVVSSSHRTLLFSELAMAGGLVCTDLLTIIEQRGRVRESDAKEIFAKLALIVKRAHDMGVGLRNIKPEVVQARGEAPRLSLLCTPPQL